MWKILSTSKLRIWYICLKRLARFTKLFIHNVSYNKFVCPAAPWAWPLRAACFPSSYGEGYGTSSGVIILYPCPHGPWIVPLVSRTRHRTLEERAPWRLRHLCVPWWLSLRKPTTDNWNEFKNYTSNIGWHDCNFLWLRLRFVHNDSAQLTGIGSIAIYCLWCIFPGGKTDSDMAKLGDDRKIMSVGREKYFVYRIDG